MFVPFVVILAQLRRELRLRIVAARLGGALARAARSGRRRRRRATRSSRCRAASCSRRVRSRPPITRCSGGCAPEQPGDHVLRVSLGGDACTRRAGRSAASAQGAAAPAARARAILYPGEPALPARRPVCSRSSSACTRTRSARCPQASSASCCWTFAFSLVAGFAVKGVFGVTLCSARRGACAGCDGSRAAAAASRSWW